MVKLLSPKKYSLCNVNDTPFVQISLVLQKVWWNRESHTYMKAKNVNIPFLDNRVIN